jgi:hypothetical protein
MPDLVHATQGLLAGALSVAKERLDKILMIPFNDLNSAITINSMVSINPTIQDLIAGARQCIEGGAKYRLT